MQHLNSPSPHFSPHASPLIHSTGEVTAKRLLSEVDAAEVVRVVGTNVTGSLLGCQQAIRLMQAQPAAAGGEPVHHIFNFGFSKWGAKVGRLGWAQRGHALADALVDRPPATPNPTISSLPL